MVTPIPPKLAPPIMVPFTPMKVASSIRTALSPSSTEAGAVMDAPLVSWRVIQMQLFILHNSTPPHRIETFRPAFESSHYALSIGRSISRIGSIFCQCTQLERGLESQFQCQSRRRRISKIDVIAAKTKVDSCNNSTNNTNISITT